MQTFDIDLCNIKLADLILTNEFNARMVLPLSLTSSNFKRMSVYCVESDKKLLEHQRVLLSNRPMLAIMPIKL